MRVIDHNYEVLNVDLVPPREEISPFLKVDLTDLGQTIETLQGAYGVVHLGAIPSPGRQTEGTTFSNNTLSTYNIFSAAVSLNLKRVVWASSETTLGLPFDRENPVTLLSMNSILSIQSPAMRSPKSLVKRWHGNSTAGAAYLL